MPGIYVYIIGRQEQWEERVVGEQSFRYIKNPPVFSTGHPPNVRL